MAFSIKPLNIKPVAAPKVSTKNLTMPHGSLKVGFNVPKQHMAKINWGKTNKVSQKPSSQL